MTTRARPIPLPVAKTSCVTGASLLAADDGFAAALSPADEREFERGVSLTCLDLPAGRWAPDGQTWTPPSVGALVVDGMLACNLELLGRVSTELLGPGDLFCPWRAANHAAATVTWVVHRPVRLIALNAAFVGACERWPALAIVAQARLADRSDRLAQQAAALQLPRVEDRLLAVLWQMIDRFGRVAPDGVVLDLPITHQVLGQMVGAQRPTVTLAFQALADEGLIRRRADGALVLAHDSERELSHRRQAAASSA